MCFSVSVRLGGIGSTAKEGYVEALGTNGQWGGICENNFDINDANVICKMLGFSLATKAAVVGLQASLPICYGDSVKNPLFFHQQQPIINVFLVTTQFTERNAFSKH